MCWGESPTGSLPKMLQWPVLGQTKTRNHELLPDGAQACKSSSAAFPGILAGRWMGNGATETQTKAYMQCWHYKRQLHLCHSARFWYKNFKAKHMWGPQKDHGRYILWKKAWIDFKIFLQQSQLYFIILLFYEIFPELAHAHEGINNYAVFICRYMCIINWTCWRPYICT